MKLGSVGRICVDCPLKRAGVEFSKVPGYGRLENPPIMFIAEAPGETEREQKRPLVGDSGQLLRRILNDLGLKDTDCYYSNTCLCKPPGKNQKPTAEMVNACYPELMDEIERVDPKLIVALGNISAHAVGQYERGIMSVRGEYRELETSDGRRIGILPTYHPAAILRTPDLFRDLEADLARAVRIVKGEPAVIRPPTDDYVVVEDFESLSRILHQIEEEAKVIAVDLETVSRNFMRDRILDIGMSWKRYHAVSIDWRLFERSKHHADWLRDILSTIPCSFQAASFDIVWLKHRGFHPWLAFDTEMAHWLLDERQGGHSLEAQAMHLYHAPNYKAMIRKKYGIPPYINDEEKFAAAWARIPDYERRVYNATDADYTYRLTIDHRDELKRQGMLKLMKLLLECTTIYADLYMEGMWVDWAYVDELEAKLRKKAEKAKRKLEKYAPHVNVRSPKQLAAYLFDELKLSPFGLPADNRAIPEDVISASIQTVDDQEAREYWQTARIALYEGAGTKEEGRGLRSRSTSTFMLYWLAQQHPYPRYVIAYKKAQKAITTYITNLRKHAWPDGRVRPDYKLDGTLHGRFKSSRPAIHNITAGRELYDMFTAPPGYVILHADYSQADMRMMAWFSGDDRLIQWLKGDPHTEVVKEIGRFTDEDIKTMPRDELKKRRMAAKMVNFGLPYGRSAANLAPQMQMSVAEAQEYIRAYWRRLPKLKAWMDRREAELMANGQELTSPFGNKRRFPLIMNRAHRRECARLAVNFPIMASVNYLTALAHVRAVKKLRSAGMDVKVYPHLHDSINVCVPEARADEAVSIVLEVMSKVPEYIGIDLEEVPFPVEIDVGKKWGTQQHVYEGGVQKPYDPKLG